MPSNGIEGSSEVAIIDIRETGADRSRPATSWKGFFISESHSTVSKLAASGICLVGGICTGIGIQQRSPAIYIVFPILTLIAETAYFGCRAYNYFKGRNHNFEEVEGLITTRTRGGVANDRIMPEGSKCLYEEKLVLSVNNLSAMDFLKSFEANYFRPGDSGFESQVKLFQDLKNRFPNYFSRHEEINSQLILKDKEQCKIVLEGGFNCYRQEFNKKSEYLILVTIDDGDCLYDALWQGLSPEMKEDLLQKYQEEIDEQAKQVESGYSPYFALKALLCEVADKEKYRVTILKNGEELGATSYSSIDGYKCLIKDKGKFWGRHNIEGKILAEELDLNLTLIAGCDYNQQAGFTYWEDEQIYVSKTAKSTFYIENSHQHYSAALKQETGRCTNVSTT